MKILQIVPALAYGDAISDDIISLSKMLISHGFANKIYAEKIFSPYDEKIASNINEMPSLSKQDIAIYHLCTAFDYVYEYACLPCKKIIVYHNMTPQLFFSEYNSELYYIQKRVHEQAVFLADKVDFCLADSEFNKRDLINMGYKCPINVLPILIKKSDYLQEPDADVMKKYDDGFANIIFTGRVVPNKKQEDVIAAFGWYKKHINEKSRLFIVGKHDGEGDLYYRRLCRFVMENEIKDVIFTGHVKFSELLAYYRCADLFLCMSEHEWVCVPIVEAMIFDLPIVAYDASAVGETLGGGGLLIKDKDPVFVAKCMERFLSDKQLQAHLRKAQQKKLDDFSYEKVSGQFVDFIRKKLLV